MVDFAHALAIERATTIASDEYNQPVRDYDVLTETRGLIQPKNNREVALTSQAGADVGDHTIYLLRQDVTTGDRIRDITLTDDGPLYEIVGIRDHAYGSLAHLEVDARRITAPEIGAPGS